MYLTRTSGSFISSLFSGKSFNITANRIKLNENVSTEMEHLIISTKSSVSTLLDYLDLSNNIQNEIKTHTDKLDMMTKGLADCLKN